MSENVKRKHHYVPQFYLRMFASDRGNRSPRRIRLYNIQRGEVVHEASIRGQAQKHLFYGESGAVEDALEQLETDWASLLHTICRIGWPPALKSEDHERLLLFLAIQLNRTLGAAKRSEDLWEMMVENMASQTSPEGLGKLRAEGGPAVFYPMMTARHVALGISDLKIKLLKAAKQAEFLTSDDPVFRYNLYCEGIRGLGLGVTNTGTLVFLPISPEFCVLLYDAKIYKVGKVGSDAAVECTPADVDSINGLQYVSGNSNLYFSGAIPDGYFHRIAKLYRKPRDEVGLHLIEAVDPNHPSGSLECQYVSVPNARLRLSFLSFRRDARRNVQRVPLLERVRQTRPGVPEATWSMPGPTGLPPISGPRTFVKVSETSRLRS